MLARYANGEWIVRIEDIDPPREVPGATGRQLATLAAFGLESDIPVVRQSERGALYQAAVDQLLERGLAFECHCSRSEVAAFDGIHRRCVSATRRGTPAIRMSVPDGTKIEFLDRIQGAQSQDVARDVGDFVLRRADGFWAYQLAVVVDDAAQGVTDVVRGADLLASTPRQILLQRALGLPTPRYAHLPLELDATGTKLSKADAARPVDPGDPLPALRRAWQSLGQAPAALDRAGSVSELRAVALPAFDPARIPAGTPAAHPSPRRTTNIS